MRSRREIVKNELMLLSNKHEEIMKEEFVLVEQQVELQLIHTLLQVYWAFAIVGSFYLKSCK